MSSKFTLLVEEEGADMDRAEEVEGAASPDCLDRNCASLHLKVAASIAPIKEKWSHTGKRIEKWGKILMIAEGKMNFSQVAESLYTSMIERMK